MTGANSPKTVKSRRKLEYDEDYPSLPTSSVNTPGNRWKNVSEVKVCVFSALKMKFSIKDFCIKCEQIRRKLVHIYERNPLRKTSFSVQWRHSGECPKTPASGSFFFPVNFAKILRALFLQKTSGGLLWNFLEIFRTAFP